MKERLKYIRKCFHLTQAQMADALLVSKSTIEAYEYGRTEITDRSITYLCRIFDINEEWFRTGEGEMMAEATREKDADEITQKYLDTASSEIQIEMHKMIAGASEHDLKVLLEYAKLLLEKSQEDPAEE